MQENDKPVLIYATFPSAAEAERIGGVLVERGLAACVNIFPQMTAIYIWEGTRQRESEAAMLIKTQGRARRQRGGGDTQAAPIHQPGAGGAADRGRLAGLPALDRRADG